METVFELPLLAGGNDSPLSPPCHAGHPRPGCFSSLLRPAVPRGQNGTQLRYHKARPASKDLASSGWRNRSPSSPWACNYQAVLAHWAKEKTGGQSQPLKNPIYFNGRARLKQFLSLLKLMFTSNCQRITTAMKFFLGNSVQNIFWKWQSDFSS